MNEHSIRVMRAVPDEYKRVALLHDLAEDTSLSLVDISEIFNLWTWEVAALDLLTRGDGESYGQYIELIAERRIADHRTRKGRHAAVAVKIADLKDNLARMDREHESLRPRYEKALERLGKASA